jgi:hypothetical protein
MKASGKTERDKPMIYDQDLRWTRRMIIALAGFNLVTLIEYAIQHLWGALVAGLIWTGNLLFILRWNRLLQEDRDQRRADMRDLRNRILGSTKD